LSVDHKNLSTVSGPDQGSERAGYEVVFLPNREEYTPNPQATREADLHAAFHESIDTDWPAQSFVPVGFSFLLPNLGSR